MSDDLARMQPRGGTALYDAVAEAVPLAQSGHNRKKALVIISDGNDTSSRTDVFSVKRRSARAEVLVYAIGIDSQNDFGGFTQAVSAATVPAATRAAVPGPVSVPDAWRRRPQSATAATAKLSPRRIRAAAIGGMDDRVNAFALREITDDSGGRTEIVRSTRDLNPATAGIADELSRQYYLGYAATGVKDGTLASHPRRGAQRELSRASAKRIRGDAMCERRDQIVPLA